jgi:serine/threonine-protein kinase RsbT
MLPHTRHEVPAIPTPTQNDGCHITLIDEADRVIAIIKAKALADEAGFRTTAGFMVATVVSELATNILRYAGRGTIDMRRVRDAHRHRDGIEVVASDQGPGIPDIEKAFAEHYSSSGSLGLGLPSVRRIMDELAVDSAPGRGTRITTTKWA